MASRINALFGLKDPPPFTVVPFEAEEVANKVAQLFCDAGIAATVYAEGGVPQSEQGRGLQVSAYVTVSRDLTLPGVASLNLAVLYFGFFCAPLKFR